MGFSSLWLVGAPPLTPQARWVAHESDEVLDNSRRFDTLAEALAEVDFSIATGARRRLEKDDYLTPSECALAIGGKRQSLSRVALVFGRESSGLTGEEFAACNAASRIPLACEQPSLNLGQAVMLYAWELSRLRTADAPPPTPAASTFRACMAQLDNTLSRLKVGEEDNLRRRAHELLGRCDDRDLGMLMLILKRIGELPGPG